VASPSTGWADDHVLVAVISEQFIDGRLERPSHIGEAVDGQSSVASFDAADGRRADVRPARQIIQRPIAELRGPDAPPVRRVLDIGSGPGVGTCELALDVGQPGLADRLDRAESNWFTAMRAGLFGSVPSTDLASMLTSAGFEVVGSWLARDFDPPLSDAARQVVLARMRHARQQLDERLDDDDLRTLDVLSDPDDPRSAMHRADVFVASSRQIVVARPLEHP
jgi:hypothetical protein